MEENFKNRIILGIDLYCGIPSDLFGITLCLTMLLEVESDFSSG